MIQQSTKQTKIPVLMETDNRESNKMYRLSNGDSCNKEKDKAGGRVEGAM